MMWAMHQQHTTYGYFHNYDVQSFAEKIVVYTCGKTWSHLWEEIMMFVVDSVDHYKFWYYQNLLMHSDCSSGFTAPWMKSYPHWRLSYLAISSCNGTQCLDMYKSALSQLCLLLATWKQMPQINNYSKWQWCSKSKPSVMKRFQNNHTDACY